MSSFPNTPTALLTRIAAELSGEADELAWTEFFELYEPAMMDFLRRRGLDDPADVVQSVFGKLVQVLRKGQYDRSRGPFRAYLSTMLCHEMISCLRHEAARGAGRTLPLDGMEVAESNDPALGLELGWRQSLHEAVVRHVLEKTALSQQSKDVFAELERTGDSCAEVARRHGLSPATVRQISSRVSRMVAAYEKRFGGER